MVTAVIDKSASEQQFLGNITPAACRLGPIERKNLSVQVLARTEPLTRLAKDYKVSRKFLYQQTAKADQALDRTFIPAPKNKEVIFHLPVTKDWIEQFVLAQVLIGHSPFRAVIEILDSVFDYQNLSIGTVHNIVQRAVQKAKQINQAQQLSGIRVGAHDEIYQSKKPVLVGMDVQSTYCYLLAAEDHGDETTWGVHLLDLSQQGLCPDFTIADGGRGLRAGQVAAWGDAVPCHSDVFHAEADLHALALYLQNRAASYTSRRQKTESKMEKLKRSEDGRRLGRRLAWARKREAEAVCLATDIRVLDDWMRNDVLSLAGPDQNTRRQLYDFIVDELAKRQSLCPHRIAGVRRMLENHRDNLLAFAGVLDEKFAQIAARFDVPVFLVHAICELQGLDKNCPAYWQRQEQLYKKLKNKFAAVEASVCQAMKQTPRASSIVENLNSRLRNYFFLRRHIDHDYLELLRFYLNHHCFIRSERAERVGKSPAELLSGRSHPHWLELLGFKRFSRN